MVERLDDNWPSVSDVSALSGLTIIAPRSLRFSGEESTLYINKWGSIVFSQCNSIYLDGVFSSLYDNYLLIGSIAGDGGSNIYGALRQSGIDDRDTAAYGNQGAFSNAATVTGTSYVGLGVFGIAVGNGELWTSFETTIMGPYLTQPTVFRTISAYDRSSAMIADYGGTHNKSTQYDGISLTMGFSYSGKLTFYGLGQ